MMAQSMSRRVLTLALLTGVLCAGGKTQEQQAQDDVAAFYRGKTVRMLVGVASGAGTDLIARMLARHLGHHIPGNPTIVVQNMPGAGSLLMANNLANVATRDGTVIGAPLNGTPNAPLLTPK